MATAVAIETPALAAGDAPTAKPSKVSKAKASNKKKASAAKKPALHPTYLEMIRDAITSLKERTGSSQYAISKFVEDKHKAHLPANFKKLLLVQLRKLTAAGKLTKVKNSYKISAQPSATVKPKLAAAKVKSAAAKPKTTAANEKKAALKPKTKSAAVAIKTPALAACDAPAAKPSQVSKAKAPKEKKASTAKKPALHPTYIEMISDAITSLKERTGSSQYAISKFVEDKHKAHLPANFKKLLLVQLRKLTAAGKLTKVKNSYKISAKPSATVKPKLAATKVKSAAAKSKTTAAKEKKAAVKPKPKSAAVKPKANPYAPKTVAKSKRAVPKPKTANCQVKAVKTSAKPAPGKKPAPTLVMKPNTLKSGKKAPAEK